MATARVATTIHENGQQTSYSSGDPCGRHAHATWLDLYMAVALIELGLPPAWYYGILLTRITGYKATHLPVALQGS
ncbi:MAG TPA: hypothetical protein VFQ36_08705 [Ktedonobacteraceae bacterium]|nr:hypothetical protein [Ktedonobacteraceae bacterium]